MLNWYLLELEMKERYDDRLQQANLIRFAPDRSMPASRRGSIDPVGARFGRRLVKWGRALEAYYALQDSAPQVATPDRARLVQAPSALMQNCVPRVEGYRHVHGHTNRP